MKPISIIILVISILLLGACGNQAMDAPTETLSPAVPTTTRTPLLPTITIAPAPTPTPSLKLVFLNYEYPSYNINIYDISTGRNLSLVRNLAEIGGWSLSPDAKNFVYQLHPPLDDATYLLDLSTKQVRKIVPYIAGTEVWHPSGKACMGYNSKTYNNELFRITDGVTVTNTVPSGSFSLDGNKLAAISGQELRIYDIRLDAKGNVIDVDSDYRKFQLSLSEGISPGPILWSPMGDRLAFAAQKSLDYPTSYIYVVNEDGSNLVTLVDSKTLEPGKITGIDSAFGVMYKFGWSPDGSKIAFGAYTYLPDEKFSVDPQVYIVNADGKQLIKATGDNLFPAAGALLWMPDGRLLFQAGNKLVISSADGSNKEILSENFYIANYAFFLNPFVDEYLTDMLAEPFDFHCATGWTRLEFGKYATVLPGDPNRVRSEPKKGDNIIASISSGTVVTIIEGPICADGLVFWKVENSTIPGGSGWTAEGDGKEYWLEPYK